MEVLIVDDDEVSLEMLQYVLQQAGHQVKTARDGQAALDILRSSTCRLVVSDWVMPGMSGIELCRQIRKEDFSGYVYVILLTSRDGSDDVVEGLTAGADDFIKKPFKPAELCVRIRTGERILSLETRLQTIVSAIQAGVILIDAETHTVVDVNPAALAMLKASREDVVGRVCHQFICPAELTQCPMTDLGQIVDNAERVLLNATGEQIPILKTVVPVMLNGRQHLLESFVDITERKRVEQELAAHRERLEELVEQRTQELLQAERTLYQQEKLASVGQLAAGVAHEINTPIQYVGDNLKALSDSFTDLIALEREYRGLVELVKSGATTADKIAAIEQAERQYDLDYILEDTPKAISQGLEGVDRIATIVRAMKDFSHVNRGESTLADINHCLESTLTVARNEYKYVADVETDFGDLPLVDCYPSALNQVFLNLVVNAAHAIHDTKQRGKITIRTRPIGDQVEIAIRDTGTGIPEAIRKKVFDPFFTTKEVGKGTGQGLSIAHQIVVGRHQGTLSFETEMGQGTTFFVRLPRQMKRESESGGEEMQG